MNLNLLFLLFGELLANDKGLPFYNTVVFFFFFQKAGRN